MDIQTLQHVQLFDKCRKYTDAREVQASGYYPYFKPISDSEDTVVTIEGKQRIMMGSNNYLGLTHHPKVLEAAAVGVPDDIYGEEVVAYVVAKASETLSEDDVRAHCAATLPDYRVPKRVYFIDDLPKNDRGKVRRDDLRTLWQQDHAPVG